MKNTTILFLLFITNFCYVIGDDTEYKLIHKLFENYDSSIRPSFNHNITLNVTFGVALTQLIDVVNFLKNF